MRDAVPAPRRPQPELMIMPAVSHSCGYRRQAPEGAAPSSGGKHGGRRDQASPRQLKSLTNSKPFAARLRSVRLSVPENDKMTWSSILILAPLVFLGALWLIGNALIKVDERHRRRRAAVRRKTCQNSRGRSESSARRARRTFSRIVSTDLSMKIAGFVAGHGPAFGGGLGDQAFAPFVTFP